MNGVVFFRINGGTPVCSLIRGGASQMIVVGIKCRI